MEPEFVDVGTEDELSEGNIKATQIEGEPVILAKQDGKVYALEGYCSHDGGEFEAGDKLCCKNQIECPRHGARFDIKSGEATRMPAIAPISTYEVKIKNGKIFVSIEEP